MPATVKDIERRISISLSVGRYLKSADRFQDVSREFTEACKTLRQQLGANQRFVVQVDYQHYLITSDSDGNFDVEPVESL